MHMTEKYNNALLQLMQWYWPLIGTLPATSVSLIIVMANYSYRTITYHIDMCFREVFQCFGADFKESRE